MIHLPEIKGFEYEQYETYSELEQFYLSLDSDNLRVKSEGLSSNNQNIYSFTVGDENLPCVYYLFGIHGGHEWHGAHISAQLFQFFANPPLSHKAIVDWLKTKVHLYGIGFANTYGYENPSYENANGVNLNRDFDNNHPDTPFTQPETKIIRDTFSEKKPILFQDYHTRGDNIAGSKEGSFRFGNTEVMRDIEYYRDNVKTWINTTGVYLGYAGGADTSPMAHTWGVTQKNFRGDPVMSILYESAGLDEPEEIARTALNSCFVSSIYAANRVNYNIQSLRGHYDYGKSI